MLFLHVPVPDKEVYPRVFLLYTTGQFLGYGDGAVPTAGAADAEGKVGFAFCRVSRDEEGEKSAGSIQELLAVFRAEHGLAHGVVVACERPEIRVVVGVGEEADVEERIDVEGGAVLEAEGDQADGHPVGERLRELLEPQPGIKRGVSRGVNDEVGHLPDVREVLPLAADGIEYVAVACGGVGPAALLVAPEERGVVRVDEQDAVLPAFLFLHGLQIVLQLLAEIASPPGVHNQDHPVGTAVALCRRLHGGRDHAWREVINAEVTGVLESLQGVALARAGEPGDDDDRALFRGVRAARRPLSHVALRIAPCTRKPSRKSRLASRVTTCNGDPYV